jgi:L-ascorbate metabolism protein UlaG (beta-lactamase superfamily)
LKNIRTNVSRRRFLAVGSISLAGIWAGCSNQMAARAFREIVAETGRTITQPGMKPEPGLWDPEKVTFAWLGHSTVLLNFYGVTILTDPVLLSRIGANTALGTIGAKRFVAPALTICQLPEIDLVLLSHAHMDHLDFNTVKRLPGRPKAVSAHGTGDLLQGLGLDEVRTLSWGQQTRVRTPRGEVHLQAFEVKHWGARWRYDTFRGYNGYVISREDKKVIFGGDTALTDSFRRLRQSGPYDAAIMPIGAYQPWIMSHCTPEQAVGMAETAGARHFLPIHFKTFPLGKEGRVQPMERLVEAIEPGRIGWQDVGETFKLC